MPISAQCSCGKSLRVKDALAGKRVRCPECQQPLKIPGQTAAKPGPSGTPAAAGSGLGLEDLFEEEGLHQRQGATCPTCHAEMKPEAILCIECGFNTQTGENVMGHVTESERTVLGHTLLDKAQSDMDHDAELQKKLQGAGLPWWVLLLILLAIIGVSILFVIGINTITGDDNASRPADRTVIVSFSAPLDGLAQGQFPW